MRCRCSTGGRSRNTTPFLASYDEEEEEEEEEEGT